MEKENLFAEDITFSSNKKINDDFKTLKDNTFAFLSHEKKTDGDAEKSDVPKIPNSSEIDDFLNFHDDIGDTKHEESASAIIEKQTENNQQKNINEPVIDCSTMEDDYLIQYAATSKYDKNVQEPTNEKFISSEDLLSDFKDPIQLAPEAEKKKSSEPTKPESKVQLPSFAFAAAEVKNPTEELRGTFPKLSAPVKELRGDTQTEKCFFKNIDAWFKPDRLHPKVESLIYWRDVKKSGIFFGIGMSILFAMSMFSLISVFAYISLLTLAGTISFRIYKTIMSAVQKTTEGHPFKEILDIDLTLSQEKVQQIAGAVVTHVNAYLTELRRLFLVEDLVDSLKFALLLWLLTYIGAIFNGMTVVILAYVAMFTLPKVYESNKSSIDQYLDLVRSKIMEITDKVKGAIPIGGANKKDDSDKDK